MGCWIVCIDCGDVMKVCYVILVNGIFIMLKFVCIDGMEIFKGEFFYMFRWCYDIDLKGKIVGIIGIGVMVIQCIFEIVKIVGEFYVFQCMLFFVDVWDQCEIIDEECEIWVKEFGWVVVCCVCFVKILEGCIVMKVNEDYLVGKVLDYKVCKQYDGEIIMEEYV